MCIMCALRARGSYSLQQEILQLMPLPLGFLVHSAPQHYSFCLLFPQPGASESRGSQPGLRSASRTHCAHYLHTRVKDRSIHQALTLLRLNRQSLTSNRIHDQSQLCRNTGKVAVGKAPGNNRRLCTRVRQALPRAIRRPHAHRVFLPVKAAVPSGDRSSRDKESWRPPPAPCGRAARDGGSRATRCGNPAVRAAPGATPPPGARTHLPPGPGPAPPPTVMPRPLAEPRPPLPPPRSPAASGPSSDPQVREPTGTPAHGRDRPPPRHHHPGGGGSGC